MLYKVCLLSLIVLFTSSAVLAQTDSVTQQEKIHVIMEDLQGKKLEGYLSLYPNEITVSSKDNKEKSVPLKDVEFIKIEKVPHPSPGPDELKGETYYSVRLQNSNELYALKNKYTFSLKTELGVVVTSADPDVIQNYLRNDSPLPANSGSTKPFIRDTSVIFSLEIKF